MQFQGNESEGKEKWSREGWEATQDDVLVCWPWFMMAHVCMLHKHTHTKPPPPQQNNYSQLLRRYICSSMHDVFRETRRKNQASEQSFGGKRRGSIFPLLLPLVKVKSHRNFSVFLVCFIWPSWKPPKKPEPMPYTMIFLPSHIYMQNRVNIAGPRLLFLKRPACNGWPLVGI